MEDAIELGEFFRAQIGRFVAMLEGGQAIPAMSAGHGSRIMRAIRLNEGNDADGLVHRSVIYDTIRNIKKDDLSNELQALADRGLIERHAIKGATGKTVERWRRVIETPAFGNSDFRYSSEQYRNTETPNWGSAKNTPYMSA